MARLALRRIGKDEDTPYRVEAVLLVPVCLLLLGALFDLSLVLCKRAALTELVNQVNRGVAIGHFRSEAEAQGWLDTRLGQYGARAQGTVTVGQREVETALSVPADDLAAIGAVPGFAAMTVTLRFSHMLGPGR